MRVSIQRSYVPIVLVASLVIVPFIIPHPYILHVLIMCFFYAALGEAWNLLGGYTGQLSLGHAAFFGIGSYTSTMLLISLDLPPWIGIFIGAGLAALFAVGVGYPTSRLHGVYYALSTVAAAETLKLVFLIRRRETGGILGLSVPYLGVDSPYFFQFGSKAPYYYVILSLMLAVIYTTYRIERSKLGFYLVSIRGDELAAEALGVNVTKFKLMAMVISAFFTAMVGSFYAQYVRFINPESVMMFDLSLEIALVAILGGLGTLMGPIIGAFFLTPLSEILRIAFGGAYAGVHLLLYGLLLIFVILLMPKGIIVWVRRGYNFILERVITKPLKEV